MVIKTVQMGIPILISRSGLHRLGRRAGAPGRPDPDRPRQGRRFVALSGAERIVFDGDPRHVGDEDRRHQRKASVEDDAAWTGARQRGSTITDAVMPTSTCGRQTYLYVPGVVKRWR